MKTAVCFTGQCRSLEFTHESIKKNLLGSLKNYDVFMYVSENESAHKATQYMDATKVIVEPDPELDLSGINHQQTPERGGINGYMQMLYAMKKCNEMRKDYEEDNNFKYDRIIRSRLDVRYFDKMPEDFETYDIDNFLYTPDFHCWSVVQGAGHNDRFAVGNSTLMDIYLSEYDFIKKYSALGHRIHAESTLHYHLLYHGVGVKKVPIRFSRIRPGGVDVDAHIAGAPATWPTAERCS
ncbi:MAG: hypothetical protein P8M53_11760 [Pirellulales bacterium]|jgi:hypothetical protein|nr:hypothetical protein [Pirellulales bacterium]